MNYTKYYKDITNCDFDSKEYEVHHIDGNRENNDISNLVALPKELHTLYHLTLEKVNQPIKLKLDIISINSKGYNYNDYIQQLINDFIEIHSKCCKYCDYKEFLLGNIPNIHNLSY